MAKHVLESQYFHPMYPENKGFWYITYWDDKTNKIERLRIIDDSF